MTDPGDLLKPWQELIRQLQRAAGPLSGPTAELGRLLEQVARRQADFEKELVGRVLAPVNGLLDMMEQTAGAMRTQAKAFDAASTAFKQSSELLELQASLIEQAARSLRDPAEFVRSAGGIVLGRPPEEEGDG